MDQCGYSKESVHRERDTAGRKSGKLWEKDCVGKKNKRQDGEGMGKLAVVSSFSVNEKWVLKARVAKKEQMPERAAHSLSPQL